MAGYPGSGKSTLAHEIAKVTQAIIIDVDIIKTTLINSGIQEEMISMCAYNIMFDLGDFYLKQGKSVIIDSPCYYRESLENGFRISENNKASYKYVECIAESYGEVNFRLKTRESLISQYKSVTKEVYENMLGTSLKPDGVKCFTVNTSKSTSEVLGSVIEYLRD
jgi:predicted kinase